MSQQSSAPSPSPSGSTKPTADRVALHLLPITLAVWIGFLAIGIQLPVLPLHLHQALGMSPLVVGLVVGSQFVAALLSRSWAGNYADMRGPSGR